MYTFTEENYLKAIFKLARRQKNGVSTTSIADRLNTKASSVTDMVRKLAEKKLVHYKKYQGVKLTPEGEKIAVSVIRKHRLWEYFLVEYLDFNWDEIHEVAEELEHIKSEKLVERLDKFLNYPKYDPHGDPIPDKHGKFAASRAVRLADLEKSDSGVVVGVNDNSSSFLQYLDKIGIRLGISIQLHEQYDFDKSMDIRLEDETIVHLSYEAAKNILITKS